VQLKSGKVLWLIGNSNAGKTFLAKEIVKEYGGILLDASMMRTCWTLGFGAESRYENNLRIARIAKILAAQGYDIVIASICPYKALREMIREITEVEFIELLGRDATEDYPYETES